MTLTPSEFRQWRDVLGLTQQDAADLLGLVRGTIGDYERGKRRSTGGEAAVPQIVALACAGVWYTTSHRGDTPIDGKLTDRGKVLIQRLREDLAVLAHYEQVG